MYSRSLRWWSAAPRTGTEGRYGGGLLRSEEQTTSVQEGENRTDVLLHQERGCHCLVPAFDPRALFFEVFESEWGKGFHMFQVPDGKKPSVLRDCAKHQVKAVPP